MKYPRFLALLLLATAALIAGLASCGGSSGMNVSEELSPVDTFIGVSEGDFRAVRYNDRGYRDSSLNSSISLRSFSENDRTVVEINIDDTAVLSGVAIDLLYDAAHYSPVSSSFGNIVAADVELSVMNRSGIVALGQVDADNSTPLSGNFARIEFEAGPARGLSAAGDAHQNPVIFAYGEGSSTLGTPWSTFQFSNSAVTDASPAQYRFWSTFAGGDGNLDGESNIGDITPLGILLGKTVTDADYSGARADYDYNTSTTIADITPLAIHLGESTSGIEVLIGDTDTFTGTETILASHDWADAINASANIGTSTTDWSGVWKNWSGEVSLTDVQAADTNMDGIVYIGARSIGNGAKGPLSVSPTQVSYTLVGNLGVEITDFDIIIKDNGDVDQVPVADTFNWNSNTEFSFEVSGIYGAWDSDSDGTPDMSFEPGNLAGMDQQMYDDALADVQLNISWMSDLMGDSTFNEFHGTSPGVIAFSAASGPVMGTVFSDDDPDSTIASTTEGSFTAMLAVNGDFVPAEISHSWNVDASTDSEVPQFMSVFSSDGMGPAGDHLLNTSVSSLVQGTFFWGSGGEPASLNGVMARLYDFDDSTQSIDFDYSSTEPAAGGKFTIRDPETLGGPYGFNALTQVNVTPGHHYGLQLNVDGKWSSVNKPGDFFESSEAPSPVELDTFPKGNELGDSTTLLSIFRPLPLIRRNDHVFFNITDQTSSPIDNAAFQDVLASGGDEFPFGQDSETLEPTPSVRFAAGVDGQNVPWNAPDLGVINLNGSDTRLGRIDLDIQALNIGDYGFQVFDRNHNSLGYGNITINEFIFDTDFNGVDWGVNVCDDAGRGDLALADRDFGSKVLNGSLVGSAQQDVMWFEFSGTRALTSQVRFGNGNHVRDINVVASGLGNLGFNVIGIYSPTIEDFLKIGGGPTWIGSLDPGNNYEISIVQPGGPDIFTWSAPADHLVVVGSNPND